MAAESPPPPSGHDPGRRMLNSVADFASLSRVYAAAYQGHAACNCSMVDCRVAAREAVRHFCTVIREPAD
jgi:hypothetical protein